MILDGRKIKSEIMDELKLTVDKLEIKPKLVVIQIGDNEASNIYINQKKKMCEYIGYQFELKKYDEDIKEEELLKIIDKLNKDKMVNGILVQMPIPKHINADKIQNAIEYVKDVDGLTDINTGILFHNKEGLYSCTPLGIMELLDRYNINVRAKHVVIVGKSNLVGKPLIGLMLNKGATVTSCNSLTKDLGKYTNEADILVVAVGKPKLITSDMVKDGAIVIDVGINRYDGNIVGDVDYELVKDKASYITPVPGGVGQMTVAMLAKNILLAYLKQQNGKDDYVL